jgi:hypothetical protein
MSFGRDIQHMKCNTSAVPGVGQRHRMLHAAFETLFLTQRSLFGPDGIALRGALEAGGN